MLSTIDWFATVKGKEENSLVLTSMMSIVTGDVEHHRLVCYCKRERRKQPVTGQVLIVVHIIYSLIEYKFLWRLKAGLAHGTRKCFRCVASWQNLFIPYANNKGADQPISIFVIRSIDSIIHVPIKATPKTSRF